MRSKPRCLKRSETREPNMQGFMTIHQKPESDSSLFQKILVVVRFVDIG
jgi:hypothetical protein